MAWHTGWWSVVSSSGEKPKITWQLIRRVLQYSRPYRWHMAGMLALGGLYAQLYHTQFSREK